MFTDELITQVRDLAQVPDTDEDITDEFILTQAYLGLLERFTQPIIMQRNGSWLHSYTFETTAGVSRYRIPPRSITQGLEKIECATAQGSGNADSSGWYLLSVQTNIQATSYEGLNYQGRPAAFTYVGDTVEIYPTPTANWTLRMWYYLRPSSLTSGFDSANNFSGLQSITFLGTNNQYRLIFENNNLNPYAASGQRLDLQFIDGNCEYVVLNAPMQDGGALTIFTTLLPNEADLIARGLVTSNIYGFVTGNPTFAIPLPQELCNALVSYVGAVVLAEKGDSEKAQVFSQKAELAIKNIIDISMPRAKGQPSVYRTKSTYLRRRLSRGGGWGGAIGGF